MNLTPTFKSTHKKTLKNLVETLRDGQEGFRNASENVADTELKTLFSKYSLQRSKFAGELESELLAMGEEDPQKENGSVSGAIHRGWINIKAALTSNDHHAILSEAERGEDVAVKAYKEALECDDLPTDLRMTISNQALEIKAAHDQVKRLRDASKK